MRSERRRGRVPLGARPRTRLRLYFAAALWALLAAPALAQNSAPAALAARTLGEFDAPAADQGVAVDAQFFYAIDNHTIVKHRRSDGARIASWEGGDDGSIRHLNACQAHAGELWCANSNYPDTPMGSSVEIFDARTLAHRDSISLGLMDEGSLTWFDRVRDGFIVGFAHYDGRGGAGFKDHRYSSVVLMDRNWRRIGGWLFPQSVLERMQPHAASGGAIGPDGLLYVMGHDRPELYVLARPRMGPVLVHLATIAVEAEGQAFAWAPGSERILFVVDRRNGRVRTLAIPPAPAPGADAARFER